MAAAGKGQADEQRVVAERVAGDLHDGGIGIAQKWGIDRGVGGGAACDDQANGPQDKERFGAKEIAKNHLGLVAGCIINQVKTMANPICARATGGTNAHAAAVKGGWGEGHQ